MSTESIGSDVYYDLGFTAEDLIELDKLGVEWRGRNISQVYDDFRIRLIQEAAFAFQAIDRSNPEHATLLKAEILNDLEDLFADDDDVDESIDISRHYDPISGTYSKIVVVEKSLWKKTKKGVKRIYHKTRKWFKNNTHSGIGGGGNEVHIPIVGGGAPTPSFAQQLQGSNPNPHPYFAPSSPPKTHYVQPAPSTPSFSNLSQPHQNLFPQNQEPSPFPHHQKYNFSPENTGHFMPSQPVLPTSFAGGTSSNQPIIDKLSHPSLLDLGDERPSLPLEKQEENAKTNDPPPETKGFLTHFFSRTVHDFWDGLSKYVSSFYKTGETIGAVVSDDLAKKSEAAGQKWEEDSQAGHKKVDAIYSTNKAPEYTPEAEQARREHPPIQLTKLELPILPQQAPVQQLTLWGRVTSFWRTEQAGATAIEVGKVGQTALSELLVQNPALRANSTKLLEAEKAINSYLGEGSQLIKNNAGDPVFLSKDGNRRVRFDFNRPDPHNNPHMHVEKYVNGDWIGSGQIYPFDVPHN